MLSLQPSQGPLQLAILLKSLIFLQTDFQGLLALHSFLQSFRGLQLLVVFLLVDASGVSASPAGLLEFIVLQLLGIMLQSDDIL